MSISNRHEGDAGGLLRAWSARRAVKVQVRIEPMEAGRESVQHTAWLLVNLLTRMDEVVSKVTVQCPDDIPLAGRVAPLTTATDLKVALLDGAKAIGVGTVEVATNLEATINTIEMTVGPGMNNDELRVHGAGWVGGFGRGALPAGPDSGLPFGPCAAACLAAGYVFLAVREGPVRGAQDALRCVSLWSHRVGGREMFGDGPTTVDVDLDDGGLAGVGAVGSAALHLLWSCSGVRGELLAVDADERGIDASNLNRGLLFMASSIGEMKAIEAARVLVGGALRIRAHVGRFEACPGKGRGMLLSAVDTNRSREALQALYMPSAISASTEGLRAEVLRIGPPGDGACLRCFNRPETFTADAERRRVLRDAEEAELARVAVEAGVTIADVRAWAQHGECGTVDASIVSVLRSEDAGESDRDFAVGFVSAMGGAMLAAEAIKSAMGQAMVAGSRAQRATFQFIDPLSCANGARFLARDGDCPACAEGPALEVWKRRHGSGDR
jgi:hypothetical protein